MVLTELAVTGLRCIEHAELEIPAGLARVWGDTGSGETTLFEAMLLPARGRLSFMGDSSGLKQAEQDHLRVIVRRWLFWASRPGLRGQPGRITVPAYPAVLAVLASAAATTWVPTWGAESRARLGSPRGQRRSPSMNPFDLPRSRASGLCPIKALPLGIAATLGPGGLSSARSDGITGFAGRGVPGLENAIHRRPARRIPAGVVWGRSPGGVALGARTGAVSRHSSLAGRLRARGRQASGGCARGEQDTAAKQSASEMWRIGMPGISFVVSLGRGGRPGVLSAGPKLLSHRIPSKAPWAVSARRSRDQAASGDGVKGSTSNGVCAAFHVEPNEPTWAAALRPGSAERGPMALTASGLRGIQRAELEIPLGLARVCGATGSGETPPLKVMFLPGRGRSFLMRDSEHLIQPGRVHLRVIARRWRFWTSRCLGFELGTARLRGSLLRGRPRPARQGQ
jgi:hypothetical protein